MKTFTKECNAGQMKFPSSKRENNLAANMTLEQFYCGAKSREARTGERMGQAAFNFLSSANVVLARKVQLAKADPFYAKDSSDPIWRKFVAFIGANWESK